MTSGTKLIPGQLRYVARSSAIVARNPVEGIDRIRGRMEILAESRLHARPDPTLFSPVEDSLGTLHEALGVEEPFSCDTLFQNAWADLESSLLSRGLPTGIGHDADPALSRVLWCTTLHLAATRVLETGVARGVTSSLVLRAFAEQGRGHLWSVDLPPVKPVWCEQSCLAVPAERGNSWSYVRGSSRRCLPLLLTGISELDIFIHDSIHTAPTMRFEMDQAWSRLRGGGVLIVDDIEGNSSFIDFVASRHDVARSFCGKQEGKRGLFGVAVRAAANGASN